MVANRQPLAEELCELQAAAAKLARPRREAPDAVTVIDGDQGGEHEQRPPAEWLSCREAAAVTGLGQSTLERHARAGRLPSSKVGRCRRIHRADLDRFMQARRTPSQTEEP